MQYTTLQTEIDDQILIATITRPKALNALNKTVVNELKHLFEEYLPTLTDLKGVIITGSGEKSFVAGADISEFIGMDAAGGKALAEHGHGIMFSMERFSKPVIAAVNGFCLGGGCEVAMACHLRIASSNARFGQPEVNLGIIPGYGGTQRLIQLIGRGKALELMMTGDMIKADEAHRLGLVNHIVEPGQEIEKSKEIINKIASKAPVAIAKVIECVNAYAADGVDGFAAEVKAFSEAADTQDFQEGATAFLEKRQAEFKGC